MLYINNKLIQQYNTVVFPDRLMANRPINVPENIGRYLINNIVVITYAFTIQPSNEIGNKPTGTPKPVNSP